jgi:toxin ParE1/3/4
MAREIVQKTRAVLEILELADFIALDKPQSAAKFLAAVDETMEFLADFPDCGEKVPTRRPLLKGLRLWQVKGFPNHLVLFRLVEEKIEILSVFHGARSLPGILKDLG